MASRRVRIKAVANLNQRRKNNSDDIQTKSKDEIIVQEDKIRISEDNEEAASSNQILGDDKSFKLIDSDLKSSVELVESEVSSIEPDNVSVTNRQESTSNNDTQPREISLPKVPLMRRKILKIPVNVPNRKSRDKLHNEEIVQEKEQSDQGGKNRPGEGNISVSVVNSGSPERGGNQEVISSVTIVSKNEKHLDETVLIPRNQYVHESSETIGLENEKFSVAKPVSSDTEYPPPPPSPNKINRSRIKAVPRFGYRKASFSASESEDESRKHNRIRNDSVCSTTSQITEPITECFSPQRQRETTSVAPKKINRSEQTRRLAEARREFQRRFGGSKPDKHKLTMMDLIFYNPKSNPMVNDAKQSNEETGNAEEENPDDPGQDKPQADPEPEGEKSDKSDEENAMPVPQIKIGPSGEIILDEQSLVIERKEVKRQREEMQKTKIVDGDFDTGYGVYKRHKRSKPWTHEETVRFYKALNIIGTDFTLMCELFPNRTRRELKMKFKKEERVNNTLLNKAVMNPCSFEFDDLKNEAIMEEKEMEELKKQEEELKKRKAEEAKTRQEMVAEKATKKRKATPITDGPKNITQPKPKLPEPKPLRKRKQMKLDIEACLDESDADESDLGNLSASDDEIVMPQGPTRSGRMPKVTKKYEIDTSSTIENVSLKSKVPDNNKLSNVEPGSIMIVTEDGPNGEPVYKIFMVTPDETATPLNADSVKAIQLKKGMSAQNIMTISANVTDDEVEALPENNMTIPADETIRTLKNENLKVSTTEKETDSSNRGTEESEKRNNVTEMNNET